LADESHPLKFRYFFFALLALLFAMAVFSHTGADYDALKGISGTPVANWVGASGAWISYGCFLGIGLATYLLVVIGLIYAVRVFLTAVPVGKRWHVAGIGSLVFGTMLLLGMHPGDFSELSALHGLGRLDAPETLFPGGVAGQMLASPDPQKMGLLTGTFGMIGTLVISLALVFGGALLLYVGDFHDLVSIWIANAKKAALAAAEKSAEREAPAAASPVPPPPAVPSVPDAEAPQSSGTLRKAHSLFSNLWNREEKDPYAELENAPIDSSQSVPAPSPVPAPIPEVPVKPVAPSPAAEETPAPHELNAAIPQGKSDIKARAATAVCDEFVLPPVTMLSSATEASGEPVEKLELTKARLQDTLNNFGVDGQVTNYISGPRLTRYEITLSPGVMVDRVTRLENNIAMNLEAKSIRVLAPIPGRNAVGIEAPNSKSEPIFMRQILETDAWKSTHAEIPIVLGKNVSGKPITLDLAKAPHLLIAGSTGSGKSVCMNTLIMSLLFRFKPDELKLIMVDPKVVEFADYQKLPHLITPVINDQSKVSTALRWAVNEMEHRYQVLAKVGVKKLSEFNSRKIESYLNDERGEPIPDKLPVLIVIIDELADLMMTEARPEVETCISRIAAKGRAAGVHIVVATQRPSTNVITGVIKANLPTRIAFRVGQMVDSRVILDQKGAEKLLGYGDMLFLPPGSADLERVQGAMVKDEDIKAVVKFVSQQAPQHFDDTVVAEEADKPGEGEFGEGDGYDEEDYDEVMPLVRKYMEPGDGDLMKKALEVVLSSRQASTSYLQRRLKIGYNRAAELIDELEARHIIGPQSAGGSKRQLLVFDEIDNNNP